ncbi:MAG: 4-(cytidine 5'-diphospho)-2-C-methyl-D-erythritol kinase [Acidobacteria bacterium]|nr:4-(cytidine 5'-diphospho)-2-C-methyl-D-erythritol kinase [Acidobacteriota bacterium]MBS1865524.1 4-(cytidine 5'-diphospho)-2-C-methyl-D-erythritol kinase [Acidobacteriota bacterium]
MPEVTIRAFAKINLRLEILGKRPDGYHELRTIFQTVSLHDELKLRRSKSAGISLRVEGNEALSGEPVEKNLVYRAVAAVRAELKDESGVEIELKKKIPAGRGLGGGSSDAAAAMIGYLRLARKRVAAERLMEIGSALGADVPFFLQGGRALGIGRGDEIYPLPDMETRSVLVVSPANIHVPTPDAYRWLNAQELTKTPDNSKLWKFCASTWNVQGTGLWNDFEGAVFQHCPRLAEIKRDLVRRGATEALLAGSGSAVIGVFPSPAKARRAAVGFPQDETFVCETLSRSKYVRLMHGRSVKGAHRA